MIIVKIHGGLGNQMFQYAIVKSLAKKNNDTFKLDISFYPKQNLRNYELNLFNIKENIASKQECIELAGNENFIFKIKSKVGLKTKKPLSYFSEKEHFVFDNNLWNKKNDIYLDGYWQNENYFKDIKEELFRDFILREDISIEAKKHLSKIKNSQSVSLHIRRGDYVQNAHTNSVHGTCNLEYYKKAVEYIENNVLEAIFYIFSDDIKWCKENFDFLKNKVFVDDTQKAVEDLELMKNCKHNIIANSTFSWWGAWLNQNKNKIVIAPKKWFSDIDLEKQARELIPKDWVKVY